MFSYQLWWNVMLVLAASVAGADQARAARIAVVVVGHRDVRDTGLHVEQRVIAIRFATAGFQRVVVDPDVVDRGLHADRITAIGDGRATLLDVLDPQVADDDVRRVADVDADLVQHAAVANADQGDVADALELDFSRRGVAAAEALVVLP